MHTTDDGRSMQALSSATSQCPAEFPLPPSREQVPCFVKAQLDDHQLSLRYAAHAGNASGINGDSLIFSLMKRLAKEAGEAFEPPELRLSLESAVGCVPDTNCHLLIEALTTWDLPVTHALAATHLDSAARALGYRPLTLSLDARGHGCISYQPTQAARRMRAGFGL